MKECFICKKGSRMGGTRILLRGKYNPTMRSRKYPNLQWATLPSLPGRQAGKKRIKICTSCLKAGKHLSIKK